MYSKELTDRISKLLAPDGYTPRGQSEVRYPSRHLPDGALVTRSAPSPTGFVHIGTIYMSLINKLVGLSTKGVYMLRMEDTDKKREVDNAVQEIVSMLEVFDLRPDEGVHQDASSYGDYGPYLQSERASMYLGYAIDLLENGRAYACFASKEELDENYKRQQAEKVRPGYYGKWALWRDRDEADVVAALDEGIPFVLRFKSLGSHDKRIRFNDVLKGTIELPENDLDIPLIKSDGSHLPTYHLAHVVDDYLMKTNIVLRGDEWLPSTPLHLELADALKIPRFSYAQFAPISIMDGNSKRKLSKRKDPEADVKFFRSAGYPVLAVLEYLVRLANSNFEDWRKANPKTPLWDFPFSFEKWAKARGALLDKQKLDDVSKDMIAAMPQEEFKRQLIEWAQAGAPYLVEAFEKNQDYSGQVLHIEREGDNVRKDLAKWSDVPEQYGYFFDDLFHEHFSNRIEAELADIPQEVINAASAAFLDSYNTADDQTAWLEKLKTVAEDQGYSLRDLARIIRVKLTGKNRTPDLYTIMQVMGGDRVKARLQ